MRAVHPLAGTPRIEELPLPSPAPGEVLVKVTAAGLNRADLLQTAGHYPPPPGAPDTLGLELSGVVTEVGIDVDPSRVSQRVMAIVSGGAQAEYAVVPAALALPTPDDLPDLPAGALPEALATAWFNLVDIAGLRAGETVLVHGGSGGVGHVAIQLAVHLGARVLTTVGSEEKARWVEPYGVDAAIDYHGDVPASVEELTHGHGVDVILDVLGAGALASNIRMLGTGGRLAIIGLQQGSHAEIDLGQLLSRRLTIHASTLRGQPLDEKVRIWRAAAQYSPHIRPYVDATFQFDDAAAAHAALDAPETRGKVVLVP